MLIDHVKRECGYCYTPEQHSSSSVWRESKSLVDVFSLRNNFRKFMIVPQKAGLPFDTISQWPGHAEKEPEFKLLACIEQNLL